MKILVKSYVYRGETIECYRCNHEIFNNDLIYEMKASGKYIGGGFCTKGCTVHYAKQIFLPPLEIKTA